MREQRSASSSQQGEKLACHNAIGAKRANRGGAPEGFLALLEM